MADGALSFYSFVRRGLATAFTNEDGTDAGSSETTIQFDITPGGVVAADIPPVARATLSLVGPGDIVGLDSSVVVRVSPKANDFDAEYIPYALIEFDQADLPWRYTPAKEAGDVASQTDQLRPWFSLVVLPATEANIQAPTAAQKLPLLTVSEASLPDPSEAWAFAHTQFSGTNLSEQAVKDQITGKPGRFVARLMSPRLLQPKTEYVACLVPTFQRGALIGAGTPPADTDALTASWSTGSGNVILPVYYSWRFATGSVGSFEQVARLIKSAVLPETLGRRDMDVSAPGLGLPPASAGSLPAEGALQSVASFEAGRPVWPATEQAVFLPQLADLLNAPAAADPTVTDPLVVPPLYGQWYAADDTLNKPVNAPQQPGTNPAWFYELNSDPRERVAAALGTTVIQREQQALLASGWDQVAEIRTVNDKLRVLQLGRGLLVRLFERHFAGNDLQRAYHLTLRIQSRISCGSSTVCNNLAQSPVVPGFLSSQWTRFARPRGPIGRVQGRPALTNFASDLLSRLNKCQKPAPEPPPPVTHDPGDNPGGLSCDQIDALSGLGSDVLLRWALVILWVSRKLLVSQAGDCWWIGVKALRFAVWLIHVVISPGDVKRRCAWHAGTLTVQDVLNAPPMPTFNGGVFASAALPNPLPTPPIPGVSGQTDSADAAAIRAALVRLLQETAAPASIPCPPPMELETCFASIIAQLDPEETVGQRLFDRLFLDASISWHPVDKLEPIFAPPTYERPMYEPLSEVSYDWLLPGLSQMKQDTAGLAVINQRFIEAYMAGLNHEMTRELLWNEFPTDQRGTYFRQFWSIAGHILEDGSTLPPEQLRDIKVLRFWDKTASLGENSPRELPVGSDGQPAPFLVLVVRAQLIKKYPNVIVYAQKVVDTAQGRTLTGEQRHPVFYALLKPDVAFYGFNLTVAEVRGDPDWYFVLQEQPGEPKFAEEGADLATQTFTSPANFFTRDDTTNEPVAQSATSASELAGATFLLPFRLGIQGTAMLPKT
jgi:hypothetical protein